MFIGTTQGRKNREKIYQKHIDNQDINWFVVADSNCRTCIGPFVDFCSDTRKQSRNNIAALDAVSGLATAWNPNANSAVNALAVSGSTIYAGGFFSSIGGQSRNNIAALDASGLATIWDPNSNGVVNALALSGSNVYVGGGFTSIGGHWGLI